MRRLAALLGIGLMVALPLLSGCASTPPHTAGKVTGTAEEGSAQVVREARYVMGTFLDIAVRPAGALHESSEIRKVIDEAFSIAQGLDQQLSTWNSDSEVSRINAAAGTAQIPVSPELCALVARSQELSQATQGAFDITIRPLVELWSAAAARGRAPSPAEQARARALVGADGIECQDGVLIKRRAGVQIESGGIGKGIAVDRIVEHLRNRGVQHAFINFGRSTIAALGSDGDPAGLPGWTVAFDLEGRGTVSEPPVRISNETMTVSRARGTPFVIAGRSYPHLFDPALGAPARTERGAAVIAPTATEGEAYAKYLAVRGDGDHTLIRRWGVRWWRVYESGQGLGG